MPPLSCTIKINFASSIPQSLNIDRIGVKASQFSFARLQNADPVLGVDMSSTGEVGCLGDDFNEADKKISLSVKAMFAPEPKEEEAAEEDADVVSVDIDAVIANESEETEA